MEIDRVEQCIDRALEEHERGVLGESRGGDATKTTGYVSAGDERADTATQLDEHHQICRGGSRVEIKNALYEQRESENGRVQLVRSVRSVV